MADLTLLVRRRIQARPEQVFDAWTRPELLVRWWGPAGVTCPEASVDLRPGGAYAIANDTPEGRVWIRGRFLEVRVPERLVYTWRVGDAPTDEQRVTVRFQAVGEGTEVIVLHEDSVDQAQRDSHALGWDGCLEGLAALFA